MTLLKQAIYNICIREGYGRMILLAASTARHRYWYNGLQNYSKIVNEPYDCQELHKA